MTQATNTDRTFILQAMVSMAAADGDLHEREMETICSVYERYTGDILNTDNISHEGSFAEQLACARDLLTRELKETILGSAYLVLLADGRVSARERKKLMDFVSALKVSEVHRSIIFEDVERTLH